MTALADVFTTYGLPMALYTDRAHWAFHTPKAKGPVDKTQLTQVGRALAQLGVEHIPAYSPQARGRSERLNRTLQDRLVNELRVAGITTLAAANAYLRDVFLPQPQRDASAARRATPSRPGWRWATSISTRSSVTRRRASSARTTPSRSIGWRCRSPSSPAAARAPASTSSSAAISSGRYSIWRGTQRLGLFDATGQPVDAAAPVDGRTSRPPTRRLDRRPKTAAGPQRPQASL